MLEEVFQDVYTKFKLHFYQNVFQRFATREATLTTVESFCMEGIMAMGEPTIAEFSRMMRISTPNAAYKIGSLVKKGYVEKIQSTTDRREYHLRPTQKYMDNSASATTMITSTIAMLDMAPMVMADMAASLFSNVLRLMFIVFLPRV